MTESNANADQSTQLRRFQEAARQLKVDEDEAAFDEKLKSISRTSSLVRHQDGGKPREGSNNARKPGNAKTK
jgi:hypothetical protein